MVIDRPWLIPLVVALVALAVLLAFILPRAKSTVSATRWVANTGYLTRLGAYRRRLRLLQAGLVVLAAVTIVAVIGTALLVGRVVERQVRADALANRDIVLCLDVSGSMIEFDTEMVGRFDELVDHFDGERIALSVWNTTSRTVFPLTDDYALVREELDHAAEVLDFPLYSWNYDPDELAELESFLAGTISEDIQASSLAGDGLASCAFTFDEQDDDRARSIIFVTDNEVLGPPIYQLDEAADIARDRDIQLYGLFAASEESYSEQNEANYERVFTERGGLFYQADDPEAVDDIVDAIAAQQATELDAQEEVVLVDHPEKVLPITVAGVGLLIVLAWRLRT